jgi:phenylacetate-coenzyme A ligase PaaK-like adenylate-forming protein
MEGKEMPSPDQLARMPIAERQKYIDEQLREFLAYAYKNAPAVKERFDKAGVKPEDIKTADDLEKIPVLRKDDLIELQKKNPPFGGYLAVPLDELPHVYHQGLSTTLSARGGLVPLLQGFPRIFSRGRL